MPGKGGSIPLDFLRLKLWDMLPNQRSAAFYSVGALRKNYPEWFSADLAALFDLLAAKRIKPVIDRRLPMTETARAYEQIGNAEVRGKLILEVAESSA